MGIFGCFGLSRDTYIGSERLCLKCRSH